MVYKIILNLFKKQFQGKNTDLAVVGVLVLFWAFGGLLTPYNSIKSSLGEFGLLVNMISPFKWSMELQVKLVSITMFIIIIFN